MITEHAVESKTNTQDQRFHDLVDHLLDRTGSARQVPPDVVGELTRDQVGTLIEGLEWALIGERAGDSFLRKLVRGTRGALRLTDGERLSGPELAAVCDRGLAAASLTTLVATSTTPDHFADLKSAVDGAPYWEARGRAVLDHSSSDAILGAIRAVNRLPVCDRPETVGERCRMVKTRLYGPEPLAPAEMRRFLVEYARTVFHHPDVEFVPANAVSLYKLSNWRTGVDSPSEFGGELNRPHDSAMPADGGAPNSYQDAVALLLAQDHSLGEIFLLWNYAGLSGEVIKTVLNLSKDTVVEKLILSANHWILDEMHRRSTPLQPR